MLVLGAGIGGLAAAIELLRQGFEVRVLEAQAQPGGRIKTIRAPLPEGLYAEAGATHVVGDPRLMELLERFAVPLERPARRRRWPRRVYFSEAGVRTVVDAAAPSPHPTLPLSAEEEALGFVGQLERYFGTPAEHDPRSRQWPPPQLAALDGLTGTELLRQRGASPGYLALVQDALCPNGDLAQISGLALVREALNLQLEMGWESWRVAGGADGIPHALAAALGDRILYGAQVARIVQGGQETTVTYRRGGETHAISAAHVVCAVPGPVVPTLDWHPPLPPMVRRSFETLRMTATTRVFVATRSLYWNERGESGNVDAPFGAVRDETPSANWSGGLLALHADGSEARRLGKLDPVARSQEAVAKLEQVHPGLRDQIAATAAVSWSEDPLFRGSFAWLAPGQLTQAQPFLRAPFGKVHFVGDYNSHRPGFMHGALHSAVRAVDELAGVTPPEAPTP